MILSSISFILINFILPPFFFVVISTLVLASFGRSLGIRSLYVQVLLYIFEYARKSANQQKISHNKFVVGENDSSDSSDDEEVITSETLNVKKRFSLGKIGRKSTRHNLISKSDNLVLVPSKPKLDRIESLEEEEVEDTEVSRK